MTSLLTKPDPSEIKLFAAHSTKFSRRFTCNYFTIDVSLSPCAKSERTNNISTERKCGVRHKLVVAKF